MAAIKGQNVRLFLGDKCVAASTSCQLHIAAEVADKSTKDSPYGWAENEVVAKSWDASIDALVIAKSEVGYVWNHDITVPTNENDITLRSKTWYYGNAKVQFHAGEKIRIENNKLCLSTIDPQDIEEPDDFLAENVSEYVFLTDVQAYVLKDTNSESSNPALYIQALGCEDLMAVLGGQNLTFKCAVTTGADHRTASTVLKQGVCTLTDLNITAANKQNSTYTAQLTGQGELVTPTP